MPPPPNQPPTQAYVEEQRNIYITLLIDILDLACMMLVKIAKMLLATLTTFNPLCASQHPFTHFLKGHNPISWHLSIKCSHGPLRLATIYACTLYAHF